MVFYRDFYRLFYHYFYRLLNNAFLLETNQNFEVSTIKQIKHRGKSSDDKANDIKLHRCQVCYKELLSTGKNPQYQGRFLMKFD